MRKLLCTVLTAAAVFSFSACGNDAANNVGNTSGGSNTAGVKNEVQQVPANVIDWKVENGVLAISGNTRMADYNSHEADNGSIPWYAEKGNFSSVVISGGVTYLGNLAFYDFDGITDVDIAGTVDAVGNSTFSGCDDIATVKLGEGVREIGPAAFADCVSLTEINIPSSVTKIGKAAFYGCYSLTDLTIPESVQVFGDVDVFTGCTGLTIHCVEGSEAHAQAEKYGIPFDFNV